MKNKNSKVLLGAATLAAALASGAPAAQAATASIPMTAKVIAAIAVTKTADLLFGTITETGAGTVVLTNAGARSSTGGVTLIGGATGQAGGFDVKAASGVAYNITLPATAALTGGGDTMTAQSFTLDGAAGPYAGLTQTVATRNFKLGATLNVPGAQATGTYTGSVTVTAVYQ